MTTMNHLSEAEMLRFTQAKDDPASEQELILRVIAHTLECTECRAMLSDYEMLREGFRALAQTQQEADATAAYEEAQCEMER